MFNWRLFSPRRPYSVSEVLPCRHHTSFGLCLLRVSCSVQILVFYLNRKWNWRNFSVLRKWTVLTKDDLFVLNIFPLTAVNWHASEGIIFLCKRFLSHRRNTKLPQKSSQNKDNVKVPFQEQRSPYRALFILLWRTAFFNKGLLPVSDLHVPLLSPFIWQGRNSITGRASCARLI